MLGIVGKIQSIIRDATAVILSVFVKLVAKIRKHETMCTVLTSYDLRLRGTAGTGLETPRIESYLGTGRVFSRYAVFHSGSFVSFDCSSGIVELFAIVRNGIVPQCMSELSALGFDVYIEAESGRRWAGTFCPSNRFSCLVKAQFEVKESDGRSRIVIYLPLFARVEYFEVSASDSCCICPHEDQIAGKPLVFYGSSITQGCAASKAGTTYPILVGRALGMEVYNFGFSSSARGELEIARRIAAIDSAAIIVEYDHNVTIEELKKSHYDFYSALRRTNPTTLIVFISRMSGGISVSKREEEVRFGIIKDTFDRALESGDKNVILIRGDELLPAWDRSDYFADDRHPNQAGLLILAQKIVSVLRIKLEL